MVSSVSLTQTNTEPAVLVMFWFLQKSAVLPATGQEKGVSILCRLECAVPVVLKLVSAALVVLELVSATPVVLELEIEVEVEPEPEAKTEEADEVSDP